MIVKHCQTNFKKFAEDKQNSEKDQIKKKEREEQRKREAEEKSRQDAEKNAKKNFEEEAKKREQEEVLKQALAKPEGGDDSAEKKEEDTGPAPVGNGGTTDKYNWTQTLEELHVYIPVEEGLKAKNLKVAIETNRLYVKN